ncbi:EGF-like domain protein [Ancylostoma caninum]|uniref:EGF-like domain protein n=1 Tax=Ancylostoma caninum TaxID=29170 RepID=A0A368H6Q6_ANCCA|nr:EGF-like domain protein [Ancylostoma caninum]
MRRYLSIFVLIGCSLAVLIRNKSCVNGELDGERCFCKDGWTGAMCHRRMNCDGYERHTNGSCIECAKGWTGPDCDAIDCNGHGTPNYDLTSCNCEKPYSGQFCETFVTKDIYSYYNNIVSQTGALGVLSCIPLLLIYALCDRFAKRRQRERVERHLTGTMITHPEKTVNREVIDSLLHGEGK